VSRHLLARAWAAGAGPGSAPLTIDLDSTICETYGLGKEGALQHGYTGMGIEATVGPDGELARRPGISDPADRLGQEVGRASGRVGTTLAQPRHEDVSGAGGDREQGW
jgi:hypothetical protein